MNLDILQRRSLKARVTLFTLTIFLISVWSLSFYVSLKLREDMQRVLAKQQFSTVSFLAKDANRELTDRLDSLGKLVGLIGPDMLNNPSTLPEFLETRPVLLNQFNGGFIALSIDGTAVAESPVSTGRIGTNYLNIDIISAALKEGKSTIGRPYMDTIMAAPVFAVAVPVRDSQGNVIGALAGIVNLSKPNFLDQSTESYYGRSGYFLLVAPKDRLIISGTGKTRMLEALPSAGANPLLDRFVEGYDETGVTHDANDVAILASARRIHVAEWFIVAALPTDEAFAVIYSMQSYMLEATLVLTLLAGGLTLLSAIRTLTSLSTTNQSPQALPIASHDEIGELIGAFNTLLETLGQRQEALKESEKRFSIFMDTLPAAAFIENESGTTIYANQYMTDIIGIRAWPGRSAWSLFPPEIAAKLIADDQDSPEEGYVVLEEQVKNANGQMRLYQTHKFSIPREGQPSLIGGIALDITEHKQMEEQVREQSLHDALTKLPNRRLLNDRLSQAMAASKRSGCYGALLFLDLDNFKPLNDSHGHEVGDLLLIEVADRLKNCVRRSDTVARFGGDEFVVILSELSEHSEESSAQAGLIAEKIRGSLARPYLMTIREADGSETTVEHDCTASIGMVLFINQESSSSDILKRADTAMYQAKEAGRNLVRVYDSKANSTG